MTTLQNFNSKVQYRKHQRPPTGIILSNFHPPFTFTAYPSNITLPSLFLWVLIWFHTGECTYEHTPTKNPLEELRTLYLFPPSLQFLQTGSNLRHHNTTFCFEPYVCCLCHVYSDENANLSVGCTS